LDEFSTLGENSIAEFYQDRGFATSVLNLEHFCNRRLKDLTGGDREANAEVIRHSARPERGPKRDAVQLNSAAALWWRTPSP
jgi:anthranilate phosphoribosyltransferase